MTDLQKSKKPIEPEICEDGWYFSCPVCHYYDLFPDTHKSCPYCNQLLDWSWYWKDTDK